MGTIGEGLYTEEQINYVNSVKEEDLRGHLLHQVRLRDNLSKDRDAFEKECQKLKIMVRELTKNKNEI